MGMSVLFQAWLILVFSLLFFNFLLFLDSIRDPIRNPIRVRSGPIQILSTLYKMISFEKGHTKIEGCASVMFSFLKKE